MLFYLGLMGILLAMLLIRHLSPVYLTIQKEKQKRLRKVELTEILMVLLLTFLSAARYYTGTDYVNYATYYGYYQKGIDPSWLNFEPGFEAMIRAFVAMGQQHQAFFAAVSVIIMVLVYIGYRRSSEDIALSLFLFVTLYFYFNSFNVMRQYIAMALTLCTFKDIREKHWWRFLVVTLIACLFHTSAVVFIPAYFLAHIKMRSPWYVFLAAAAVLLRLLFRPIMNLIVRILPRYATYLNFEGGGAAVNMLILALVLLLLLLLRTMQRTKREHPDKMTDLNMHINLSFWALVFMTFSSINTLFSRVGSYYFLFTTMALPLSIKLAPKGKKGILTVVIVGLSTLICLYYLYKNISGVVPYQWCFGK